MPRRVHDQPHHKPHYKEGTRTHIRQEGEHALRLRWVHASLIGEIRKAADKKRMSMTGFVVHLIERYLQGAAFDKPHGVCEICRRRMDLLQPKGEKMKRRKTTGRRRPRHQSS